MMDIDELKENILALKNEAKEEYEEAIDLFVGSVPFDGMRRRSSARATASGGAFRRE